MPVNQTFELGGVQFVFLGKEDEKGDEKESAPPKRELTSDDEVWE